MIRRPPRSTLDRSSAASDVYKRQAPYIAMEYLEGKDLQQLIESEGLGGLAIERAVFLLSLIHISEPTRPY